MRRQKMTAGIAMLTLSLAAAACGSVGGTGGGPGGVLSAPAGENATVDVEVQANDVGQQLLQVVTPDGRQGIVRWDAGTRVVYKGETYSAAALERGDLVQMRLHETSDGDLYTDYVQVTRSVQERGSGGTEDDAGG